MERVAQEARAAATQPAPSALAHHCQPRCRYQAANTGPNAWERHSALLCQLMQAAGMHLPCHGTAMQLPWVI